MGYGDVECLQFQTKMKDPMPKCELSGDLCFDDLIGTSNDLRLLLPGSDGLIPGCSCDHKRIHTGKKDMSRLPVYRNY